MDFLEFYKELEAEFWRACVKLMGIQLLQLELRLGKNPSRSFRPVKSAEILWQFWTSFIKGVTCSRWFLEQLGRAVDAAEALWSWSSFLSGLGERNGLFIKDGLNRNSSEGLSILCPRYKELEQAKRLHSQRCADSDGHLDTGLSCGLPASSATYIGASSARQTAHEQRHMGQKSKKHRASVRKRRPITPLAEELKKNKASASSTSDVEAIGSFDLILPSEMILVSDDCHFPPTITRGVILLSRLWDNSFRHKFIDNDVISVSKDNIVYFNVFPRDGIFEIDMHNHMSNERSIYTCRNKKTKHNLDSTFLWHCHLGHINKKRITKLQHDELLELTDDESFDVCVSCISGKMARKPFTHTSERADDLLGIIHSDVCGPFRTTYRERANYYVTFTDDFSRYAALSDPESEKWLEAMNAKMQSMKDNQVWNLVDLPPNCKTVGSKWLFKKKTDMDGNIHTYKARLIAKGFTQTYGVDYEETFSLVADIKSIRILIAIAAYYDYKIWFVNPKHPRRVCKLQRSIYELKQASRSWNKRFDEEIKKYGFTQNPDEPCVYKRASRSIIMDTSKRGTIPMQPNVDLRKSQGPSTSTEVNQMKGISYASVVGSIMYVIRCTRPDVAFSQNLMSRYQQNPGESHWTAVKNILKYLRNTKDMFLVYGGDSTTELGVTCYTDASCSKQSTIAMSSMEAEYIAAVEATMEAIWICKFIYGLGVVPNIDKPMDMYCDNTCAITIVDEPGVQKGTDIAKITRKRSKPDKHEHGNG
ncbi:retrotransposon protein, putative, ty1-copia subclass [Tanacetum coccineum]